MARVPLLASRVEQRAVIRFIWAKGLSTAEIHNEMQPVYGHKCFNLSVVKRWCRKFSNGRTSLVDNKRSGLEKLEKQASKNLCIAGINVSMYSEATLRNKNYC